MENIGISEDRLRHTLGVARKAYEIAKEMGHDERFARRMFMLGWVHDVGYEFTEKQSDHPNASAELLWTLGDAFGVIMEFPRDKDGTISSSAPYNEEWVSAVSAIENHGRYTEHKTAEWKILNMADMLIDSKGNEVMVSQRLDDIKSRYGEYSDQYLTACDICYQIGLTAYNFAGNIS